ncbi:hypothetical protein [Enterobacter mori]|uniref:hypothetical protein n=1 Tax=Enterobacter mori TaxID=539813 RepID=UPI00215BD4B7|nr:hypothetical protein [Enterobacter mori]
MITEKNNVFYCDCGFSFQRGRSGSHDCADGLRNKLAEYEAKCAVLAAELRAVEAIHNEAVFITDEHYEQCPPEVQKIVRSLAVLRIPAHQNFLAEVRVSAVDAAIEELNQLAERSEKEEPIAAEHYRSAALFLKLFADSIRKGVQS